MATFVAVDGEAFPFVAVIDGFLSDNGDTVEIGGMWVDPRLRRTGIGHELLVAVCDWARERGAGRAGLWVRAANTPARFLYERAGFEVAAKSAAGAAGFRLERTL
jgi:GNAT superfamily N-acetyltransferase